MKIHWTPCNFNVFRAQKFYKKIKKELHAECSCHMKKVSKISSVFATMDRVLNPFLVNVSILHTLKTPDKLWFSDI